MSYEERFTRNIMLLGEAAVERLRAAHVAVIGLGGVGSYTAEAIARAGVGEITLLDSDIVNISNINRQLIATGDTVGMLKTDAAEARILSINPEAVVHKLSVFYDSDSKKTLYQQRYDYLIDAIDTVSAKTDLIVTAHELEIPIISALGTGNKLDPTRLEFADIFETSVCPLARAMRRELRKRGVERHLVLYSREEPFGTTKSENGRNYPGSISWVPGCAGLMLAGRVITELTAAYR